MAFNDSKIAEAETTATGVVSQPDTLLGSPQQNKAVFDALPLLIIERLNALIDALQAGTSASELGAAAFEGVTADNVQDALEAVQGNIVALQDTGGAADIGVTPFEGVTATNAQQALQQLQANLISLRTLLRSKAGAGQIGVTPFPGVGSELLQEALQEIQQHINDIQVGMIPDYGVTWEKLAQDIVDEIEKITPSRASGELDDYTMETGTFENAGAGWNSFRFRSPFDGIPVVTVTPQDFSGWCEVKEISCEGFLYCLRRPGITGGTAGSVSTKSVYVAGGTGTSPSHSAQTLVDGVTLPTLPTYQAETTADKVKINYSAIEYGGDL